LPLTAVLMGLRITLTAVAATPFHLATHSRALAAIAATDFLTTSGALLVAGSLFDVHSEKLLIAPICAILLTIALSQVLRLRRA
jgi:hypothetical protein